MNVAAILKQKGREVFTTTPDTTLLDIATLLGTRRIGCIVVTGIDGKVIGIVSERDYARKVILLGRSSSDTPVWQIMTSEVVTVSPDEAVHRCMEIMTEQRIRHLGDRSGGTVRGDRGRRVPAPGDGPGRRRPRVLRRARRPIRRAR